MTADAGLPAVTPEREAEVAWADPERASSRDAALQERARRVIPGGMYGHQSAASWPAPFPQFLERGRGCGVWDVDGREYEVWLHPWHNGFLSVAHADADVHLALERTDAAFAAVRSRLGPDTAADGKA
jgi:glutamate-1-semialdehyde aminotransferase